MNGKHTCSESIGSSLTVTVFVTSRDKEFSDGAVEDGSSCDESTTVFEG